MACPAWEIKGLLEKMFHMAVWQNLELIKKDPLNFLLSQSKKRNPSLKVYQLFNFYVHNIGLYRQSWDCLRWLSEIQIYLFLFGNYPDRLQNVLALDTQNAKASTQMLIGAGSFQLKQRLWLCSGVSPGLQRRNSGPSIHLHLSFMPVNFLFVIWRWGFPVGSGAQAQGKQKCWVPTACGSQFPRVSVGMPKSENWLISLFN